MKNMDSLITRLEAKETDLSECIEDVGIQIQELEQRKWYLQGRLYEVHRTQTAINVIQGNY